MCRNDVNFSSSVVGGPDPIFHCAAAGLARAAAGPSRAAANPARAVAGPARAAAGLARAAAGRAWAAAGPTWAAAGSAHVASLSNDVTGSPAPRAPRGAGLPMTSHSSPRRM